MAPPISLALGRFKQLPQRTSEIWQGGLMRLPTWIENPDDPEGTPYQPMRKILIIIAATLVGVVLLATIAIYWFFSGDGMQD